MILDTNGLSAVVEGDPAIEPLLRKAAHIAIPVVVLSEYRYGISHSRYRNRLRRMACGVSPDISQLERRRANHDSLCGRSFGTEKGGNANSFE